MNTTTMSGIRVGGGREPSRPVTRPITRTPTGRHAIVTAAPQTAVLGADAAFGRPPFVSARYVWAAMWVFYAAAAADALLF